MIPLLLLLPYVIGAKFCVSDDIRYEFTECDSNEQRWRVAVPRNGIVCESLPTPQRAINCSFSCHAGHYLDLETQECRKCKGGEYSLGGGERFDEFNSLPHGFSIENVDPFSFGTSTKGCPDEGGWVLRDGELLYKPTPCISRLSFSVRLVRPGAVEFSYRMPRNNRALSMQVDVQNELCQSYTDMFASMTSANRQTKGSEESNGDWKRRRVDLRSGPNVISWTVADNGGGNPSLEPIHISRIDVHGMAFTRECSLCPAGTYSEEGSGECLPCMPGYFSSKGSRECGRCPQSQYSGPKAAHCIERPPCKAQDFYPVTEPCSQGTTRTVYKKVQPAVCRDDLPESVKVPQASERRPCPKCNAGMAKDPTGTCVFCPKGQFSNGNDPCQPCPVNTRPSYAYEYSMWEVLPPNMDTRCEYISEEVLSTCDIGPAWLPSGTALVSTPSLQKGIAMELMIDVDQGFFNPLLPEKSFSTPYSPISTLTIVFETSCVDHTCVLYFIQDMLPNTPNNTFFRSLAAFNGTQPRRVWSFSILTSSPTRFMIAFLRSGAGSNDDALTDTARIFTVNITNVGERKKKQGGGAGRCMPCAKGGTTCVPCPGGHYMNEIDHSCHKCPDNTVARLGAVGPQSCTHCGENLISIDGTNCITDGSFNVLAENRSLSYDFRSWLNKTWEVQAVKVFSREGASYYHIYNVSLFGKPVSCQDRIIRTSVLTEETRETVEGAACRITALPDSGFNKSITNYLSPFLMATRLEAITTNRNHSNWTLTDQVLEYEGVGKEARPIDVHFWFESTLPATEPCPNGIIFVATARCQPTAKEPNVRSPRNCPDGTCDGCLYHIIFEAAQACPVCRQGDYDQIKGECINGKQTIHSIPAKHCVVSGAESASREEPCSVFSAQQRALLTIGCLLFIALSASFVVICRRNRRLEYKYTRLVESHNGELPAVETCGLEEDEDEEDRVTFSKGRRNLFGRKEEKAAFVPLENDD